MVLWQLILSGFAVVVALLTVWVLWQQTHALQEQVRMLETTIHMSVYQGLNSNFFMIDRLGIEHPDAARALYLPLEGKSDEEIRLLMFADLVLNHLDSVYLQKQSIPQGHLSLWTSSAELMLNNMPLLHEWIDAAPEVWSLELRETAQRCRPRQDTASKV